MTFEETVQKHYFHEVERRKELRSSLTIPVAVAAALLAGLWSMLGSLSSPLNCLEWTTLGLACAAAFTTLLAAYFAWRSFLGYSYKHPTTMRPLGEWRAQLLSDGFSAEETEAHITGALVNQYMIAADDHALKNDRKSAFFNRTMVTLTIAMALTVAAGIPYWIGRVEGYITTSGSPVSR